MNAYVNPRQFEHIDQVDRWSRLSLELREIDRSIDAARSDERHELERGLVNKVAQLEAAEASLTIGSSREAYLGAALVLQAVVLARHEGDETHRDKLLEHAARLSAALADHLAVPDAPEIDELVNGCRLRSLP